MATFPTKESLLNLYFIRAYAYIFIAANLLRFLVSTSNQTELTTSYEGWTKYYPLAISPSTSTEDNVANKNIWMQRMLAILRKIFADIANSVLTPTDRATLLIPILGVAHPYVPMPDCWPIGSVKSTARLSLIISYFDSLTGKKSKPQGVKGCEIWFKVGGTEPVSISEMTYLKSITKTPFVIDYDGTQGGMKVYFWIRWIDSKNEGKWGPCISGTILP